MENEASNMPIGGPPVIGRTCWGQLPGGVPMLVLPLSFYLGQVMDLEGTVQGVLASCCNASVDDTNCCNCASEVQRMYIVDEVSIKQAGVF